MRHPDRLRMDVNERFEQWLKSLTMECEAKSSQIKGNSVTITCIGDKKKDKNKKAEDQGEENGNHMGESDVSLEESMEILNKLSMNGLYGNSNDSLGNHSAATGNSEHDDLNEILKELTSSHESSNNDDNGIHGDLEPTVGIGGIHMNSAGRQSPKFLYKDPNSPTYMYFNPSVLSPVGKKSK